MTKLHSLTTYKHRAIAATVAVVTGTVMLAGSGSAFASTANEQMPLQSDQANAQMMQPGESQAATDLRVGLNNLLREHVTASLNVTRGYAAQMSEADINGAIQAQYANSDALSAAVGSVYGAEAQAQFSELFKEHIVASNQYAQAVGAGDNTAKQAADAELKEYLNEIAGFFSTAIPGLPAQDVYGLLNEHEELINKSTEAYKAGDFVQSYQLEREALKQISGAADALASGIIATQPAKFE